MKVPYTLAAESTPEQCSSAATIPPPPLENSDRLTRKNLA